MCAVSCGSQRSHVTVVVGRLATWRVDVDHPRLRTLSALLRLSTIVTQMWSRQLTRHTSKLKTSWMQYSVNDTSEKSRHSVQCAHTKLDDR